jgi:cbb3-type cytochrome oxidase maturation protein
MDILFLLIPLSVVLVFVIGVVFWWSIRHGQFEDMEGPAYRVLMDDDSTDQGGGGHHIQEQSDIKKEPTP